MSNTFLIRSALTSDEGERLYIDIPLGSAPAPKANEVLDLFTFKNQQKNQLWEAIADPSHPGYFFIQSLQPDNEGRKLVIDIQGVGEAKAKDMAAGTPVDAFPPKDTGWHENQLWAVALNPESTPNVSTGPQTTHDDYVFIQSYLTNSSGTHFVIDIHGWTPGTKLKQGVPKLHAYPQKTANTENQLWRIDPGQWEVTAPQITAFISNLNVVAPFMTVTGTGFGPGGVVLVLWGTLVIDPLGMPSSTNQPGPILGVCDFAGNFSVTASFDAWGLGTAVGGEVATQAGQFHVSVAPNSGSVPQPVAASAQAWWSGSEFTDFSRP